MSGWPSDSHGASPRLLARRAWRAVGPLGLTLASLGLVLATLAVLQLRWTDELTRTARASLRASLSDLGRRVADDVERELAKPLPHLAAAVPGNGTVPEDALLAARDRLMRELLTPGVIEDFYIADAAPPCRAVRRLAANSDRYENVPCPEWLQAVVERESVERAASQARGTRRRSVLFERQPPAIALGIFGPRGAGTREVVRWLVVRYSEAAVRDALLAALLARPAEATDVQLLAVSDLEAAESATAARFEPELAIVGPSGSGPWRRVADGTLGRGGDAPAAIDVPLLHFFPLDELRRRAEEASPPRYDAGWQLQVRVPAGPLAAIVERARRRNLAVGFGVLFVLAAASVTLVSLARRAERLAGARLRFVSGVTHELRTPVASIRSLADNLADGLVDDPDRLRAYGEQIRRDAARLGDLVEDTLLVGGLRAGVAPHDLEDVSLADAARAALASLSPRLTALGLRLDTRFDEAAIARGRRAPIERAVANLIENAAKFSPRGGIVTLSTAVARGPSGRESRVCVTDQGPGFDPLERSSVFQPFFRGREATARGLPGSGLGLAVVQETASAFGGRVEIGEAKPSRGTAGGATVSLSFPLTESAGLRSMRRDASLGTA
jgi:signal transduction histidine kinase